MGEERLLEFCSSSKKKNRWVKNGYYSSVRIVREQVGEERLLEFC